jgi:hypothetical protein
VCLGYKAASSEWRPFIFNISGAELTRPTYEQTYLPTNGDPLVAEFIEKDWQGFYKDHTSGWLHVLAVRDPLERLLSGYMNKGARP